MFSRLRTFFLTLTIVATLLAMFFLPRMTIGDHALRKVNILSDVQKRDSGTTVADIPTDSIDITDSIANDTEKKAVKVRRHVADSVPPGMVAIEDFGSADGTRREMDHFYAALDEAASRPVRIAYFGDSFIEGDILTSDLRESLQSRYGGRGVGWVDITSITERFRQTVIHKEEGWRSHHANDTGKGFRRDLQGMSASYFIPNGVGYVQLSCQQRVHADHLSSVDTVTVFYSPGRNLNMVVTTNGTDEHVVSGTRVARQARKADSQPADSISKDSTATATETAASPNDTIAGQPAENEQPAQKQGDSNTGGASLLAYGLGGDITKVELRATGGGRFFGITMDGKTGVCLDNLSMRGSGGQHIENVPDNVYEQFASYRDYDLIILHFGLNVASKGVVDYQYYTKRMVKALRKLRAAYPRASILVVSVSDVDKQDDDGQLQTMDGVKALLRHQRRMASDEGVAFWSLYDAMGGELSMERLAKQKKANLDYTHVNSAGGRELARLFFEVLMNGKTNYDRRQ